MTVKNTLLEYLELYVDTTTIHVTLHFMYGNCGTQQAGPYVVTNDLLIAIANLTDEQSIFKIKDKPCRVMIDDTHNEIVQIGHFLREEWFPLTE